MKIIIFAALLLLTVLSIPPAFAAHPLVGDDTGTHGSGKYQLEVNSEAGFDRQKKAAGESRASSQQVAVIISTGLGEHLDLVLGVPWQSTRVKQNGSVITDQSGAGDTSLEVKWRFLELEGFSLAIKPGVTLPTGDEDNGVGNGRVSGGVSLIATREMAPATIHLNAAYFRNEYGLESDRQANRSDIMRASLAAMTEVIKDLQLVAEVGLESNSDRTSRSWPAFVTCGLIYNLRDALDIDFGIKQGLNGPASDLTLLAGVSTHF